MSDKKIKEKDTKEQFYIILFLNLELTFMIFIFSPMDTFLRNQKDFGISIFDALLPLSIAGVFFFTVISLIMFILNKKLFKVFSAIMFGLLVACYIQILFFNGNMAAITGDFVNYAEKTLSNYINLFIFVFILLLPLIIVILKKLFPNNKIFALAKIKMIIYLSAFIFIIQICGVIGTVFSIGLDNIYTDRLNLSYRISYKDALSLSDDNIVVFLVDRLDGDWFDDFLNEYPEMKDELSGFTYYRNNISCYVNTFPSVPEMLTNCKQEKGESLENYLNRAWESRTLTDVLHENNYGVNLLIDNSTTYNETSDLVGKIDNIRVLNRNYRMNYIEENGILRIMLEISFGKLSPYFGKNLFLDKIRPDFSNHFIVYSMSDNEDNKNSESNKPEDFADFDVGYHSDINFYKYIKKHKLNKNNDKNKTFNFIHLYGAHGVNGEYDTAREIAQIYDSSIQEVSLNSTIRGEFAIMLEYIEQMKQLGIYDNSTIIMVGDHGRHPLEIKDKPDKLNSPIITGLLVKRKKPESIPLIIENEAELSNANFFKSILDCANIESEGYEPSYFDIIENNLHPIRKIDVRYLSKTPICRYEVTGDARNFDNWKYFPND